VLEIDGVKYELVITGEAIIIRGPLGRFVDLAEQIQSEGLTVPPEILAVLDELQQPQED
jgi:hypothetical protein